MGIYVLLAFRIILSASPDTTLPALPSMTGAQTCAPGLQSDAAATCLNQTALALEKRGDFAGALRTLEDANRLWTTEKKPAAALHVTLLSNLGETYEQLGRWREARECFLGALATSQSVFSTDDIHTAYAMVRLATMEMLLGNPARSDELLNAALPVERRALPDSALELSAALSFAAMFHLQKGEVATAEALATEGMQASKSRSTDSPEYAASLTTLAGVYIVGHDLTRATPLLNRAVDILERTVGPEHPRLAPVLMDRAMIYQGEHKTSLAEADGVRAVAILTRQSGPDSISTAWAKARLSGIYLDEGKTSEAEEILPGAVERQRRFYERANWRVAASIGELGRLRTEQTRFGEAEELYREALAIFDATAPNNPEAARAMRGYADLLRAEGGSRREIRRLAARAKSILETNQAASLTRNGL